MKHTAAVVIAKVEEKILDVKFFSEFENKFPEQFKDGRIRFDRFIENGLDVIHIVGMNILVFKNRGSNLMDYREEIKNISIREVQKLPN